MNDRYQEAIVGCRADIIAAGAAKLGRELSPAERAGIGRIASLMLLESVCQSFTSEMYSAQRVEADLRYFASQPV